MQTPRLSLREMTAADLDFVAAMLAEPQVMRYYPKCYDRGEAEKWLNRQIERYQTYGHGLWLVLDRTTNQPVGQVGLVLQYVISLIRPENLPSQGVARRLGMSPTKLTIHAGLPHTVYLVESAVNTNVRRWRR